MSNEINEIRRIRYITKSPYYSGNTSTKTEYEFFQDGTRVHQSRTGKPFNHVTQYKKHVAKKFDVDVEDIQVSDSVQKYYTN